MTEVLKSHTTAFSSDLSRKGPVVSVKRYEAKPPANLSKSSDLDNLTSATKEEEWVTKKKVELTTKKQIETRVKRQVVLEDGKVVEDSGPIVTTNTTEDTEKQEHEQTEHRQLGNDEVDDGWVAVPGTNGIVKEVRENKVRTREEKEERLETEDVQHLGDISDDAYRKAVQSGKKDIRLALRQASSNDELAVINGLSGRVVHHSTKNHKTVDTEDTKHLTGVQEDGKLVTETTKTTQHEEINDTEEPDNEDDEEEEYETHQSSSQKFRKTKDQEFVEYLADGVKIGEEMRYEAENVEADRKGNPNNLKMDSVEWESLSERIRRMRREKQKQEELERMDALTKKPLNFDQEEATRKKETSKWLENHFGSESRSSKSSFDEDDPPKKSKTSTSYINVTMKSAKNANTKAEAGRLSSSNSQLNNRSNYFKGISEWNENSRKSSSPVRRGEYIIKPKIERTTSLNNNTHQSMHDRQIENSNGRKVSSDNERSFSPFQPIKEKHQTSSRYYHHESTSSPMSPPVSELESSPLYASVQQRLNGYDKSSSSYDISSSSHAEKSSNTHRSDRKTTDHSIHRSTSPQHFKFNGYSNQHIKEEEEYTQPIKKSNLVKRESTSRQNWNHYRDRKINDASDDEMHEEPAPDYSPRLQRHKAPSTPDMRPTTPTDGTKSKKIYQKTRFSADIPLVKRNKPISQERKSNGIGETFRRLVGKFRSGSSERKNKKKMGNETSKQNGYSSYQSFNAVDNQISSDSNGGDSRRSGRQSPISKHVSKSDSERGRHSASATSPTVSRRSSYSYRQNGNGVSQTLDRNYYKTKRKEEEMHRRSSPVQKYYLGEDPFGRSIYGKEKEYDGATTFRRKIKSGNSTDDERKGIIRNHTSVTNGLGTRLSKSTSRLTAENGINYSSKNKSSDDDYTRGGIQTLPRKLRDGSYKKQVYIHEPTSDQEHSRRSFQNKSNSQINVSVVNKVNPNSMNGNLGPTKPARTYRTSVTRSKSFNVQPGFYNHERTIYKSNPQLHTLEESPPPLKSPSIVTSINRSTKDLSKSTEDNLYPSYKENQNNFSRVTNGYTSDDSKRKLFMKGILNRSPETTYKEDEKYGKKSAETSGRIYTSTPMRNGKGKSVEYSNSFTTPRKPTVSFDSSADRHSPLLSNSSYTVSRKSPDKNGEIVNKNVTKHGNNDDYLETVRITSKSNDPIRPSVTNTVQSFSKKTLPSKDGRLETIESSETTRVTKSHYRGNENNSDSNSKSKNRFNSRNGSVIIEVRNGHK